ncbi:hypothetical protein [Labrenzia sp. PHM005]|uniref:hypothetical protein n=1 Tax=Labrenzia sp. PHM005 TaxID=2590016 RepID=UPI0011404C0E|nr:hypothetical protein [Labrenzia sp. PHM005]QDG76797.1 hypothetical protein FJ695_13440 [Labrenzia sp. PHM005]
MAVPVFVVAEKWQAEACSASQLLLNGGFCRFKQETLAGRTGRFCPFVSDVACLGDVRGDAGNFRRVLKFNDFSLNFSFGTAIAD